MEGIIDVYFAKLYPDVKIPTKRDEDAGYDIYAYFDDDYIKIEPQTTAMIPTGIISAFPKEIVGILKERGSTGTKGMGQRSGVIDSGYRGEWIIPITNLNKKPIIIAKDNVISSFDKDSNIIYPYSKAIAQCLFLKLPQVCSKELSTELILSMKSERGSGKLGSTNK